MVALVWHFHGVHRAARVHAGPSHVPGSHGVPAALLAPPPAPGHGFSRSRVSHAAPSPGPGQVSVRRPAAPLPPASVDTGAPRVASAEALPPESACYNVTYRHRPTAGHLSREKCGEHANLIQLSLRESRARLNSASICVRLDGTPVPFERVRDTLWVGPLAGPNSVIQVHYCLGRARCADPCTVAPDSFLATLGVRDHGVPGEAQWDPDDGEASPDVTADLEAEFAEPGPGAPGLALFKDWEATRPAMGCGQRIARSGR